MSNLTRRAILRGSASGVAVVVASAIGAPAAMSAVLPTSNPVVALAERAEAFRIIDNAASLRYRDLIRAIPEDLRHGPGTPYRFPADMPPEVLARYKEFSEACSQAADGDMDSDAATQARWDVEDELCATPADNLAGLLAKLRWLVNNLCGDIEYVPPTLDEAYAWSDGSDDIQRMIVSAWADAERLAAKR